MIFLDTNVISETLRKAPDDGVLAWLVRHDAEIVIPTVTIAEIAFGIQKIKPDQRAERLERGLLDWRCRPNFWSDGGGRAGLWGDHGEATRRGQPMSAPDGMIAAIARVNGGRLATRNLRDFASCGLELVSPWDF